MPNKINIIGKNFGDYIVISEDTKRNINEKERKNRGEIKYNSKYYLCKCKCGNIKSIKKGSLLNGKSTNCGCNRTENRISILNKRFGKLLVLKESKDKLICTCLCDCGNIKNIKRNSLIGKYTNSCGCLLKEKNKNRFNKNNFKLDYENNIGYGYTSKNEFIFDLEDYKKISSKFWKNSCGYIYSGYNNRLHNFIMNFKPHNNLVVDHINRNPLDNRKDNLRIISQRNNTINSTIGKNNKSGFIGVRYDKSKNKWIATIKIDGVQKTLKSSIDKNIAIKTRLNAELKYFGKEFAPQRHLFNEYGITLLKK